MSEPVEAAIPLALMAHLSLLSFSPTLPIIYPNKDGAPLEPEGSNSRYLSASFLPASSEAVTIPYDGGIELRIGIFQVSVFYALNIGEVTPYRVAAAVAQHFKRGTRLIKDEFVVKMVEPPTSGPALYEKSWLHIPVSIPYRCYSRTPA